MRLECTITILTCVPFIDSESGVKSDKAKTKVQLIREVKELRAQVACLASENNSPSKFPSVQCYEEERYRLLMENVSDIIWMVDLRGRYTFISSSVERILGRTPTEIMSLPLDELHGPEQVRIIREHWSRIRGMLATL